MTRSQTLGLSPSWEACCEQFQFWDCHPAAHGTATPSLLSVGAWSCRVTWVCLLRRWWGNLYYYTSVQGYNFGTFQVPVHLPFLTHKVLELSLSVAFTILSNLGANKSVTIAQDFPTAALLVLGVG